MDIPDHWEKCPDTHHKHSFERYEYVESWPGSLAGWATKSHRHVWYVGYECACGEQGYAIPWVGWPTVPA